MQAGDVKVGLTAIQTMNSEIEANKAAIADLQAVHVPELVTLAEAKERGRKAVERTFAVQAKAKANRQAAVKRKAKDAENDGDGKG